MSSISREVSEEGALAEVLIGVPQARRRVLERNGLPVPEPVVVKAVIDSGAYSSGVHESIFEHLELWGPVGVENVLTCSTAEEAHPLPVYVVSLTLLGGTGNREFPALQVLAHVFGPDEEARALIGRDILNLCVFKYDGPGKIYDLVW